MKTYLCRFTYSKGNGYALVTANRVSGIENILRAQGMWEGVHVLDCKELDICIPLCGTLVITATGITTLGMSAYDLAVDAGFEGTTEEWLASLIGSKGDKGDTGEGIASGGKEGQILKKNSDADYDTRWEDFVIPDALILSDWELSDNTKADFIKNKPTIPAALVLSDWNEDNTTSKAYIQNKPTNVSTFNNDSGFITKTVDDLVNYYLKRDIYTKDEVQQLVSAIKQFRYEVVPTLPEASAETMHCIYLVPSADPQSHNIKDEYITIQSDSQRDVYFWEQIGSTAIDLSGYYTSAETDSAISAALNTALANYTTTNDLTTLLAAKANADEMSVVDGTGTDADKTTITLKTGTSATVLKSHQSLAGKQDLIDSTHKLSADLVDDTNTTNKFVTANEKTTWNNKSDFSGSYNDLSDKPTIPVVPTNVSAFNNDAGYLTQHQDISGKQDKMSIVTWPSIGNTATVVTDSYNKLSPANTINTLQISLSHNSENKIQTVVIYMETGTTPAITWVPSTSGEAIYIADGFAIEASSTYEVNALWNGTNWYIAGIKLINTASV